MIRKGSGISKCGYPYWFHDYSLNPFETILNWFHDDSLNQFETILNWFHKYSLNPFDSINRSILLPIIRAVRALRAHPKPSESLCMSDYDNYSMLKCQPI